MQGNKIQLLLSPPVLQMYVICTCHHKQFNNYLTGFTNCLKCCLVIFNQLSVDTWSLLISATLYIVLIINLKIKTYNMNQNNSLPEMQVKKKGPFRWFFNADNLSNVIEKQQNYVLTSSILGYLIGWIFNLVMTLGPYPKTTIIFALFHGIFLVCIILLYGFRKMSLSTATGILLLFIISQLCIGSLYLVVAYSQVYIITVFSQVIIMVFYFILAIMTRIRFLLLIIYIAITGTLIACSIITSNQDVVNTTILLSMALSVLLFMSNRLKEEVTTLQEENNIKKRGWFIESLNISNQDAIKILQITNQDTLTNKQKERLLNMLDEKSRNVLLNAAIDIIEKRKQNISILDSARYGFTPYEKQICMAIIEGLNSSEIAAKFNKNFSSITTARGKIRRKLGLDSSEELQDSLIKLVTSDFEDSQDGFDKQSDNI